MSVTLIQDEAESRLYHLSFGSHQGGHLLYVFPFEKPGDQDPRAAWREATHRFRRYSGSQVERLLLAAQGESAGYVLTGSEEIPRGLKARIRTDDTPDDGRSIQFEEGRADGDGLRPWWAADLPGNDSAPNWGEAFDLGMVALGKDQLTQALSLFQKAVEENPFHREAYLAVLGVLDTMSNYDEADMYAEMAMAQLPDDGLIRYRVAILHVRQWRHDEALAAFDDAVRLEPTLYQAAFFASHLMLARLQDLDGAVQRLRLASALSEQDPQVLRCLRAAEACRVGRRLVRSTAVVAAIPALGAVVIGRSMLGAVVLTASLVALLAAGKLAALVARWSVRRASLLIDGPA
jgi:tetratricopeptide (TPR) repeat protein